MSSVDALLADLRRHGVSSRLELSRRLGVSQSSVARLLTAAGERVCRMGRTKGARYAATQALPAVGPRLPVHEVSVEGRAQLVGELVLLEGGGSWLERESGAGILYAGLPPAAIDMGPQGYLGRTFTTRHPDLPLPARISDWSDAHRLLALARRGEDCVGNLIFGRESLDRWLAHRVEVTSRDAYPDLARASAHAEVGSSAGGEHPKFLVYNGAHHVLVKFMGEGGAAADRWKDLLACEALALEAVRSAGLDAAPARWFDVGAYRFLEVERFDRCGDRGRRGVLSLGALDAELLGSEVSTWTGIAAGLRRTGRIDTETERAVRWLDVFGQLIGNDDRHAGNLAFFSGLDTTQLRLAPVYDMLPMRFAPAGAQTVERVYQPSRPTSETLQVWPDAAAHACRYWERVAACRELSGDMRGRAEACLALLEAERREQGLD